jgi:hypothetical protein
MALRRLTCLWLGRETPSSGRLEAPRRQAWSVSNKPEGGLWTCLEVEPGVSAWLDWCRSEAPGFMAGRSLYRLRSGPARVYRVDGPADLARAYQRWPAPDPPGVRPIFYRASLDWPALALAYDALELTERGLRLTGTAWPIDGLYGWDVPTVLWLRWCFEAVERVTPPADSCEARR